MPDYHITRMTRSAMHPRADAAHLLEALKASNGNKALAARFLKCSRTTLYRRLEKLRSDGTAGVSEVASKALSKQLGRSEEHTSELQSLMRISYAVFCLKKKKQQHE